MLIEHKNYFCKLLLIPLFALTAILSQHNIIFASSFISTYAGNGTAAFGGDGGLATAASLSFPGGVVMDGASNLYIADKGIIAFAKWFNGIITTIAAGTNVEGITGDGDPPQRPNSSPRASRWTSLEISLWRTLMASSARSMARAVSSPPSPATQAAPPDYPETADRPNRQPMPADVAVDGGNIYIADSNNNRVRKINASGIITTVAGNGSIGFSGDGGPATSAGVSPTGVAVDGAGNLYIADALTYFNKPGTHRVRKVDANGIITTVAGNGSSSYSGDGWTAPPPPEWIQITLRSTTWEIFISAIPATIASEKWTPPAKSQRMPVTAARDFPETAVGTPPPPA